MLKTARNFAAALTYVTLAALLTPLPVQAQDSLGCGNLANNYGPFDYTNPVHRSVRLPVVEQYHFDSGVQALKGMLNQDGSEFRLGGDIEYVLRAFPNHHPALYLMIRYYLEKVPYGSPRMTYAPPCWFERARRFAPHDGTAYMLEGIYFQKNGDLSRARSAYEAALERSPDSAEINYNAALLFIDLEEYERAANYAERAYALGHPLPGLRRRLQRLGLWESESQGVADAERNPGSG